MNVGRGYAVVEHGNIDVSTVHTTRRGAIVNWLIKHDQMIHPYTTDSEIEDKWLQSHQTHEDITVHVVIVSVEQ